MYTELQVTSNFTFLRGGSHPDELAEQAAAYGYKSIAITDRNTLAGIVRAHTAAKKSGIRIIPACRLDLQEGGSLLAYPTDVDAYARISNLLTVGNLRTEKGKCILYKEDLFAHAKGSLFIVLPPTTLNKSFDFEDDFKRHVRHYREALGENVWLAASKLYNGDDAKQLYRVAELCSQLHMPMIATNDVHYHHPSRRELQDIATCIREKCSIHNAGFRLHPNAERHLKPIAEMQRLFRHYPDAIRQTQVIDEACTFSLDQLHYQYPDEVGNLDELIQLTMEGARRIYGQHIPDKIVSSINHEIAFIKQMDYAKYFLTVYDIVREARERNILCQGRGSAANSTVCFCLGITSVDPSKFELLFERFISPARNEPPDIDVDFEHERREEIMQYIFNKYGRDRAAVVATVTQQHHKGAIRDVGKAMGLSIDTINRLSGLIWDYEKDGFDTKRIIAQGLNPDDPLLKKVLELTTQFLGFPRQLGQHTGGFVITQGKLSDLCPIINARMEDRTNIEWNKDDIDALGFMKIDVLALGMLTCIRKGFTLAKQKYNLDLTLANIPQDDPVVYDMITLADTIGVFQIESRAQQSMLPRLKPKCFYDLVIEVAIVRPGPIQGDMVHPYLRRRNGEEKVEYPSKELEEILSRTLGVPLFQEQAMKIAIVAAGFTAAEADGLRRSMATFKAKKGQVAFYEKKLTDGMIKNGYTAEYAQRVFKQLEGFSGYGFPESHAASFALLVYVSSWLKCYYPDVFACAILNSLPMGFYQPAQLVIDARNHGVEVRPVDINYSHWDNTLEEKAGKYFVLRLGFRHVKGLRQDDVQVLLTGRNNRSYCSIHELRKMGLSDATLERLADADAFRSIGQDRRKALWEVTTRDQPQPVFSLDAIVNPEENKIELPEMHLSEHVVHDYAATSLSLKAHPLSFIRPQLDQLRVLSSAALTEAKNGYIVKVAGLILVRQRPGTASGICFITLEDELGQVNLVVYPQLFDKYRKEIMQSRVLMVEGKVQREGTLIHVIVKRCFNYSRLLQSLTGRDAAWSTSMSRADETTAPVSGKSLRGKDLVQGDIFPKGRNFK